MKQLLITLVAAAAVTTAFAQAPATTVKIDPKNNKVSKPVVDKPKVKLLTRDELRFCLTQDRELTTEAKDLKAAEAAIVVDKAALKEQRQKDEGRDAELTTATAPLKADIAALSAFATEFQANTKLEKAELKAKQEEYGARSTALQTRIDDHNKALQMVREARTDYNARADVFSQKLDAHNVRVEKHLDKYDAKDAVCKNKSFDIVDEAAVKKELAATP